MFGIYDINNCSNLGYIERLDIYKKSGFEEIALYIDDNYQAEGENYTDIIEYARQIGLEIKQAHVDWKISNLICDNATNQYFDYVSKKVDEAKSFGIKYVVAHASQSDNPPVINNAQLLKFKAMMEKIPDGVMLCLENVRKNDNLDTILSLNLSNVGVCFDLGHAHCYGDEKAIFEKYKDKIVCSHLHNNHGKDTHEILTDGDVDYIPILQKLDIIPNVSNCLECFPPINSKLTKDEFVDFVQKCYDSVNSVEFVDEK